MRSWRNWTCESGQVRRWRREGLLSREIDWSPGSVVRYPKGTCAQIRALALSSRKRTASTMSASPMDAWFPGRRQILAPRLKFAGRVADQVARLLPGFVDRFDRSSSPRTFGRGRGRQNRRSRRQRFIEDQEAGWSRSSARVRAGHGGNRQRRLRRFRTHGHGRGGDKRSKRTVDALDLQPSGTDSILGHKLNLLRLLPSGLDNVSTAISMGHFAAIADAPAEEIAKARNDARNGVLIGYYLHEANRWIYDEGAFGLRLLAWIARKAPDPMIDGMTLLMFRLRQVPTRSCRPTRSPKWRSRLARSTSVQGSWNGYGATIPASRKSSNQSE